MLGSRSKPHGDLREQGILLRYGSQPLEGEGPGEAHESHTVRSQETQGPRESAHTTGARWPPPDRKNSGQLQSPGGQVSLARQDGASTKETGSRDRKHRNATAALTWGTRAPKPSARSESAPGPRTGGLPPSLLLRARWSRGPRPAWRTEPGASPRALGDREALPQTATANTPRTRLQALAANPAS